MRLAAILPLLFVPAALAACIVDGDSPRRAPDPAPYEPAPSGASSPGSPPASATPILVEIDTDQTMSADPGQGVGVFVEYGKGGQWHVWWTCDTLKTQKTCDFNLSMSVATGQISSINTEELAGGLSTSPSPTQLDASTTTSTQVHGVRFATAPGAVLTLSATVSGLKDGSYIFFVQDGKVNGGFQGQLTNPLKLQGKTP